VAFLRPRGDKERYMPGNDFEPDVLAFCCEHCAYAAADLAGSLRLQYPPNVKVLILPCSGRVEVIQILRAFEQGVDGVLVAG
jgi:coenzyme F420-reducing hydrogenase delta subunit